MTATAPEIHRGLAGVVVDTTEISTVIQETNSLTYRATRSRTSPPTGPSRRSPTSSGTANCPTPPNWRTSRPASALCAPWTAARWNC